MCEMMNMTVNSRKVAKYMGERLAAVSWWMVRDSTIAVEER